MYAPPQLSPSWKLTSYLKTNTYIRHKGMTSYPPLLCYLVHIINYNIQLTNYYTANDLVFKSVLNYMSVVTNVSSTRRHHRPDSQSEHSPLNTNSHFTITRTTLGRRGIKDTLILPIHPLTHCITMASCSSLKTKVLSNLDEIA